MVKAIPMEDWLRGCVYHDGRHGEVILPTDKVLQIANYIQRTRRSVSDGLIDLKVEPIADTPQTERRTDRDGDVWEWRGDAWYCIGQANTPQTESTGSPIGDYRDGVGAWQTDEFKNTDCPWK